jgi:hypothetical protein
VVPASRNPLPALAGDERWVSESVLLLREDRSGGGEFGGALLRFVISRHTPECADKRARRDRLLSLEATRPSAPTPRVCVSVVSHVCAVLLCATLSVALALLVPFLSAVSWLRVPLSAATALPLGLGWWRFLGARGGKQNKTHTKEGRQSTGAGGQTTRVRGGCAAPSAGLTSGLQRETSARMGQRG